VIEEYGVSRTSEPGALRGEATSEAFPGPARIEVWPSDGIVRLFPVQESKSLSGLRPIPVSGALHPRTTRL